MSRCLGILLVAATTASLAPLARAATYSLVDLGPIVGTNSRAVGINDSGQIVGNSQSLGGFITTATGPAQSLSMVASGVNSSGTVIGHNGNARTYNNGTVTDLGNGGGQFSYGWAINNNGQATGTIRYIGGTVQHASRYSGGVVTDLGTLGGNISNGRAINSSGIIAGESETGTATHAFYTIGDTLHDIGTLGGNYSQALGINDGGDVVGNSVLVDPFKSHAFLYHNGAMTDLGTLGGDSSSAADINNLGTTVGRSRLADGSSSAFVKTTLGGMQDLNLLIAPGSGWQLIEGLSINDVGQIVGYGYLGQNNVERAFLLNPLAVPEPSTLVLAAFGLAGVAVYAARKRRG